MFPSKLQKNIHQLDRRISVLENECHNMELDKKKKKFVPAHIRSNPNSKSSDISVKSSKTATKVCVEGTKKIKKVSPSSRVQSTYSTLSNGGKPSNLNNEVPKRENRANKTGKQNTIPLQLYQCPCDSHSRALILCKSPTLNNRGNGYSSDNFNGKLKSISLCKGSGGVKKGSIIHKEVLYTNPDGSIEVTVKQKSSSGNQQESESLNQDPVREVKNTEVEYCKCQCYKKKKSLGQKWSEILSLDCRHYDGECREALPKVLSSVDLVSMPESQDRRYHKQSSSDTNADNIIDQLKIGKSLMPSRHDRNYYKLKGEEQDNKGITMNHNCKTAFAASTMADPGKPIEAIKNHNRQAGVNLHVNPQSDIFTTIQKLCDNLIKEKDTLTREVATKNNVIERMKNREEDFVSLIDSLKMSLNKMKSGAEANLDAENELKVVKQKLTEQEKVVEALKKNHIRLKEMLAKSSLENDRLLTEIQIYKLESQKHDVLMAGKEAEIKRYKEEIGNFQKQISEHLACLKSNSQVFDVEKMMETIIHQSRIFGRDDLDAALPPHADSKALSKCHNGLMHSSPTSTKGSDVNSSWREISSIRTQEARRAEDGQEAGDKEFFQVYGGEGSVGQYYSVLPKMSRDSIAFTSRLSAVEKEEGGKEGGKQALTGNTSENLKNGIDRLLQGMKLKWSQEVYKVSTSDNDTIEDFLNGTLVSSLCE